MDEEELKIVQNSQPVLQNKFRYIKTNEHQKFDKIYLMTSDETSKRFRSSAAILQFLNLNFDIIQMVDPSTDTELIKSFLEEYPSFADTESKEVKITHFLAYIDFLINDYDNALFLEDDVDFDMLSCMIISKALEQVPENWDYMGLFYHYDTASNITRYSTNLIKLNHSIWIGGVAYALSRKGLQTIFNAGINNTFPGDVTIASLIDQGELDAYIITPLLVDHLGSTNEFPSLRTPNAGYSDYKTRLGNSIFNILKTN
ncbi:hypothetical protein HDV01_000881 [Terramyces sp. JEL0728]|nr:hypothetical protein HDV01_000881 [Terramyces sp. JEL0728]